MATIKSIKKMEDSDLKRLIELVSKNFKIFIVSIIFALGTAFLANLLMTPKYKISSSLLIKDGEKNQSTGGNMAEFLNSRLFGIDQNFQNELWVLKSTPVIQQTIKNLDLKVSYYKKAGYIYKDAYGAMPFRVLLVQNHVQPSNIRFQIFINDKDNFEINANGRNVSFVNINTGEVNFRKKSWKFGQSGTFGKLIETADLAFIIQLDTINSIKFNNDINYSFVLNDDISIAKEIQKEIQFKVVDKLATVIEIIFKCPSEKKGKDIVNEIMNAYSQQNLESKNHNADITINYIERQLDEISDSLRYSEDKLQYFRSSNQLLNFTDQANSMMAQYRDLENQLAELETRKRYYNYVSDYLNNNDNFSNIVVPASMGISDQLLNNLMSELIATQAQRSNLIQNKQELNPMVQKLSIQIENIKKTISDNISAIRTTADISIDEIKNRISNIKETIGRMPITQRQLGGIERKYKLNDAIYNYLLEKRAEAKITLASNIPDNMIIEPAKMEGTRPVSPNKQINYIFALFLGLIFPFSFLTLKKVLNQRIESQESIEVITNTPVFGKIIHNSQKEDNVVFVNPTSIVSESFRTLRTNIDYQFKWLKRKVILITSAVEGEGKSFNALNLAVGYAKLGRRTLLMNCDLRKPMAYFNNSGENSVGLSSWYTESLSLEEIIIHSPYENLDYIQSGPIQTNPAELLAMKSTTVLFDKLKTIYDCIILDTSPLAILSDTYLLMDYADIKIVIIRFNYSVKTVFTMIMNELKLKNINNMGIVINDTKAYDYQKSYSYNNKERILLSELIFNQIKKTFRPLLEKAQYRLITYLRKIKTGFPRTNVRSIISKNMP